MSVWLTIPSARPVEEVVPVLKLWRERGYQIALWRDDGLRGDLMPWVDHLNSSFEYPGYAQSVNALINNIISLDANADWFVCAGDDTEPDPDHSAEEIAQECANHFGRLLPPKLTRPIVDRCQIDPQSRTFGVMQPTGDRWHEGVGGFSNAPIDRVAGSPWIGREFARRMYGGKGPYWPEYQHMFVDEELQNVAEKYGVFWQRSDLTQRHNHWGRGATDKAVIEAKIPAHLVKWNTPAHWRESKALFESRKAKNFPGVEPIA